MDVLKILADLPVSQICRTLDGYCFIFKAPRLDDNMSAQKYVSPDSQRNPIDLLSCSRSAYVGF